MLDFSDSETAIFTKLEQRILLMAREYNLEEDRIRLLLTWPLEPLNKTTWRGHRARIMKKIRFIRERRARESLEKV